MKATVLGCGLVGGLIVKDLAERQELDVLAVDADPAAGERLAGDRVEFRRADLSSADAINAVIEEADVVVGAVPGRFGYMMLETVIRAGKPVSDISFAPENALELDALARDHATSAVIDAGVSPGLSNLAIGRSAALLDEIDEAVIYVGGLPLIRRWPWEYRSVFSPTDVIEEYLRPARIIEEGRVVTRAALSEVEPLETEELGTLEAFNTDGLRTLLHTVTARNMREKTLRYPGHADRMRALRETGFFSDEPLEVDGAEVVPRRVTETLLFEQWARPDDEMEVTYLEVTAEGPQDGEWRRHVFRLVDQTDLERGDSSMARTTGFPCAILAGMLARGEISESGVIPLEQLGRDGTTYDRIVAELAARGVVLDLRTERVENR